MLLRKDATDFLPKNLLILLKRETSIKSINVHTDSQLNQCVCARTCVCAAAVASERRSAVNGSPPPPLSASERRRGRAGTAGAAALRHSSFLLASHSLRRSVWFPSFRQKGSKLPPALFEFPQLLMSSEGRVAFFPPPLIASCSLSVCLSV